jgi:amino acid adenylation domain-containing protein/non-ribosomal peptide synthase protein (TIGR01720 family)
MGLNDVDVAGYRLSPQQRRLWRVQRLHDSREFMAQCSVLIEGALDMAVLAEAIRTVVQKHEILRTTFRCLPGVTVPVQVTDAGQAPPIQQVSSESAAAHGAATIEQVLADHASRPLDLTSGPLLQVSVLCLEPGRTRLILSLPSLCADRTGLANLVADIGRHYAAGLRREIVNDEPLQYADLAEWQNQLLETDDTEAGRTYWKSHRPKPDDAIGVPFARQPIEGTSFHPQTVTVPIGSELSNDIEQLSRQLDAPVPVLLLSAWRVLLGTLSEQAQITVGTIFNGRNYEQLEGAIGLFARYLPVRCAVDDKASFSEVLRRIGNAVEEISQWQEYFDWDALLAAADDHIDQAYYPLCFDFEEIPPVLPIGDGTTFGIDRLSACTDHFRIKLSCTRRSGMLSIELHYDDRYYAENDIQRLAAQLQTLLASIAQQPTSPIDELDVIGDAERHRLLVEWNRPHDAGVARDTCVTELFEAQVERSPDAVAVASYATVLDYRELNARANQLARYLRRTGVGTDRRVGLCVERSPETIVAMLGILKAGGAYVPLDPGYPSQRLAYMIEDAGISLLLTQQRLRERLPQSNVSSLCLDTNWEVIAQESRENVLREQAPDSLAYIIYTSGSTGRPKGVMVSHRGLARYLNWSSKEYRVAEGRGAPLHSPLGFDLTITSIFPHLLAGQCVTVLPEDLAVDELGAAFSRTGGFSLLKITPSHLAVLGQQLTPDRIPGLAGALVVGGEALHGETLTPWQTYAPRTRIINEYGPTEAVVGCCIFEVSAESGHAAGPGAIPIGKPTPGTQLYALNSRMKPVPMGTAGELYIGGAQLARGYLGRPDATAASFVPDAFGAEAGARLYKTADLARFRADANLEFLGRVDHQVKVRGFRIELGEIEAVLGEHPAVQQSVVIAREDTPGDVRLVAYLIGASSADIADIRAVLSDRLPDYMMPAAFVTLESLPLTANGKVDRDALPPPEATRAHGAAERVKPRNPYEEIVANQWSHLLRVENLGVHDNFFDLGGHSLLATQVLTRLNATFHVKLSYRDLFDSPTVAGLAERVEAQVRKGEAGAPPPLQHVGRDQDLPLSFAQERLWLLDKLEQGSAYHISWCGTLKGSVNVAALEQVLSEIVRRHEALRTTFVTVDGRARQVVSSQHVMRVSQVDVTGLSAADGIAEARRLHGLTTQRPFDLSQGPLLRATLVRTGDREHLLLFTMHHIVSDAWSKGVLAHEVSTLYEALVQGRPSRLDELKIQYADYAYWQRQWLVGESLDSQISYWKTQLAGAPPALELPTDRARPSEQTFNGALVPVHLTPDLSRRLAALGRGEGATVFMTLLAAFQALLHRLTGQPDIVVGTPLAGRTHSDTEDLIGFFVNTLAMRADLGRDPTFAELLAQVRKVALEAYAHQDLPFEKLVNELEVERDLSRTPLFQAMFVLQNAPGGPIELAGLRLEPLEITQVAAKFDLSLYLTESPDSIEGALEYNTDLFDAATIERIAGYFEKLIAGIVADPDRRISEIALLSEAERRLLVQWNDTTRAYPRDETTRGLFEAQVARTPDTIAVVAGAHHVTYRELNGRANRLAHHLRSLGVAPEDRVGLCLSRSADLVASVLGVLKAGGTYVGIDPEYPPSRIAFMIGDSTATVIVTETGLSDRLPEHQATTVYIDADAERIARCDATDPAERVSPDCLSHVIYTSGSTGVPKGVAIEQRSVATLVRWSREHYADADLSGVLASTSVCFDLSVWELFVPLSWGGTVVLVDNALALQTLPGSERVTLINTVPSAIAALLRQNAIPASARTVNLAGEPLTASLADTIYALPTIQRVCDLYGPSEDTTYSTYAPRTPGGHATIGQPLADTQAHVLGAGVDPAPVGVPGELHLAGEGLARGYLNRPDLTADRFVPNPYASESGSRMYRTGDRMRWLPDGTLEFLGRIDHQVKIRGFRIELGEIETVMRQHPAVRDTVVLAREDSRGQKRLVAYLVAHAEAPSATELRTHLKASLPDYMVPTEFVTLDALPLTPNGKLDRRALPEPEQTRPDAEMASVDPRGSVETTLAVIWKDILSLDRVGVHDNFFHVGGDSIIAIQIVVRANQAGLQITPKQIFEYQTIAELAAVAGTARVVAAEQGIVIGAVPLTPIQRWFFDRLPVDAHHFNQAVLLEARVRLNPVYLKAAVEALFRHHDALRHRFAAEDGEWRQESGTDEGASPMSSVDLSAFPPAARREEMTRTIDSLHASFDLGRGPLFHACHFVYGDEPDRLFLIAHHLVVDGVSWRILLADLWSAYELADRGSAVTLPAKTTAFQHWARRLNEYAQGAALPQEIAYWERQTANGLPPLPTDRVDGLNTIASRTTVSAALTELETQALLTQVPEAYGTQVNDVLLTALLQAFADWTGSRAMVIDLEGHGREELFEDVDLSRTVGWFTTLFPVRLELPESEHSGEALKAVKEQLRAIPQRGLGYGLLRYVREQHDIAQLSSAPHTAEVSFNYLGQFDQTLPDGAPFRFASESAGREQSERAVRSHQLDIVGMIIDKRLRISFQFSENLHRRETIEGLADRFGTSLRGLIEHCLSPDAGGASPSDFPLADVDQATLDRLLQGQQS